jgi:hypothetical protein
MTEIYNEDYKPITDPLEREAAFKPIYDYIDSLGGPGGSDEVTLKSVLSQMKSAKAQFTNLVYY